MNTFNVYLPPATSAASNDTHDLSRAKFLPDAKSIAAVLLPPIWLIWHRLWWALGVYVAVLFVISMLGYIRFQDAALFLSVLPGLYLLLEGHELVRQKYENQGWQYATTIQARNVEDAELQFYQDIPTQSHAEPIHHSNDKPEKLGSSKNPVFTRQDQSIGLFAPEN